MIASKKAIFIASENGNGNVFILQENQKERAAELKIADDECLVGVYNNGDLKNDHIGKSYRIVLARKESGINYQKLNSKVFSSRNGKENEKLLLLTEKKSQ